MEAKNDKENSEDAKKYFDETKYRTAIIGAEDTTSSDDPSENRLNNLIALLTDDANKDFKEETLLTLKKEKAGYLLIDAINKSKKAKYQHTLVAACWESEINFSEHFSFFIDLAMAPEYLVSLEAITVMGNMEGPFKEGEIAEGIKKLKDYKQSLETEQQVLINDLIILLQDKV